MTTYDDIVLSHGPILYLPLDDTSGTTAVALAGSNGTYVGSPTLNVQGPGGQRGVDLNGSSQYITTNTNTMSGRTAFTVEFWMKQDVSESAYMAGVYDGAQARTFELYTGGGNLVDGNIGNGSTNVTLTNDGTASTVGVWNHVAYSWNGSVVKRYLNGVQIGTADSLGSGTTNLPRPLFIGALNNQGSASTHFDGKMSSFAVYDTALSDAQILSHYDIGKGWFRNIAAARADELGAVLHLPLDDVGGTVARATVGSNGTYSGGPTLQATGPSDYLPYAADFSGSSQYVTFTHDSSALSAMSIEAWVKFDSNPAGAAVISEAYTGSGDRVPLTIITTNGSGTIGGNYLAGGRYSGSAWAFAEAGSAVTLSQWYHVVAVHTGASILLYVNGSLVDTVAATFTGDSDSCYVARTHAGAYMDGSVAAVTIYDFGLTADQVYENYRLGLDLGIGTSLSPVGY